MTLQELNRLVMMKTELAQDEEVLQGLIAAAQPGAQKITGMPLTSGYRDKIGDLAVEIADMRDIISELKTQIESEEEKVKQFIDSIPKGKTKMVFRLRFIRGLTWKQVSATLGKYETENSVKDTCYSYLNLYDKEAEETQMSIF